MSDISQTHKEYAKEHKLDGLALTAWRNQFDEAGRDEVIALELSDTELEELVKITDRGERTKKIEDYKITLPQRSVVDTKTISLSQEKPAVVEINLLVKSIVLQCAIELFGMVSIEVNGKPAVQLNNDMKYKCDQFMQILFAVVLENDPVTKLVSFKLAIRSAMCPLWLKSTDVSEKDGLKTATAYAGVIELKYQQFLGFPTDDSIDMRAHLLNEIANMAIKKIDAVVGGSSQHWKKEVEQYVYAQSGDSFNELQDYLENMPMF